MANGIQQAHGFVNRTDSTLTFTASTPDRTLTITGTYTYYYQGIKVDIPTSKAVQIDNTNGLWYVYFSNSTGTLAASQSPWNLRTNVPVCSIWWNGTVGIIQDERHGYLTNLDWHEWAHDTIGARYQSGIDITNTGTGASATFSTTSGAIHDEDIDFTVNASSAFIPTAHACRLFYQSAAGAYTLVSTPSTTPFLWNGDTSRVQYVNAAGPYALADAGAASFVNVWVYAAPDIGSGATVGTPIYMLVETIATATGGYNTVGQARAVAPPSLSAMGLAPEMKLLYRLVVSGDGTVQSAVAADDYRNSSVLPAGGTPTTSAASVLFSPVGNIAATNVQSALEEVDNEKVDKSTYDANTILYATTDNTPVALTVGTNTVVGRINGDITTLAIDSDLSSTSAGDDSVPSAKATKAMGDLKLPLAGGTMTGKMVRAGVSEVAKTYTPATGAQTVTIDCAVNNMHVVAGHADGTAITFAIKNATDSQPFIISVLQGSGTVSTISAWFDTVRWAGGSAPTLTATLNKRDTFGFIRTGSDTYDGVVIAQNC